MIKKRGNCQKSRLFSTSFELNDNKNHENDNDNDDDYDDKSVYG